MGLERVWSRHGCYRYGYYCGGGEIIDFQEFKKIPRLSRECVITEKIDGINSLVYIGNDGVFLTGSRNRWITPTDDNFGFSTWAHDHKDELMGLGPGYHYGEWWGQGIQRKYGLTEKRWSLFNTSRWELERPTCCYCVPVLYRGVFESSAVYEELGDLLAGGSIAAPGFMNPEGVVIYHIAAGQYFKKTILKDDEPKGAQR